MSTTSHRAQAAAQAALRTGCALAALSLFPSCQQMQGDEPATAPSPNTTASAPAPTAPSADPTVPPANDPAATMAAAAEESLAAPASPAVMASAQSVGDQLAPLAASVKGSRVLFTDCADDGSCTTRVETRSLAGLRGLLASMSDAFEGISFVVRERLDAYTGKWYQSDVSINDGKPVAVPADENELLVNFGDPPDPASP